MAVDLYYFDFNDAIVEPPTSNQVRINAAAPYEAASTLWIRNLTTDGLDVYYALRSIGVGSTIVVQDKNEHARGVELRVVGAPIDKAAYFEIPVVWVATGALALANNQAIALWILEPAVAPTPEPEPGAPPDFFHVVITEPWIPLTDAKAQLRITDSAHDDEVSRTVLDAQNTILDYLKHGADPTWTATTVPYPVLAAVKRMLTHLYEHRGAADLLDEATGDAASQVWEEIERLLVRFRDPALA